MEPKVRKYWPVAVLALYALHGIWLVLHIRLVRSTLEEVFGRGDVAGVRFNLVSLIRMLGDSFLDSCLAIAGALIALVVGRGALRIVLAVIGFALWAAYAWTWVFLAP